MAAKKGAADTLNAATIGALASDPQLRKRTQAMFNSALQHAEYILNFGQGDERASLIKSIVPQMMRSLQDEQADVAAAAQRAAYDRMRAAMRGE
jgi:hypothetical protein